MEKAIVIISHDAEPHAKYIYEKLLKLWEKVYFMDTKTFPSSMKMTYSPDWQIQTFLNISGKKIIPKSIFWRWFSNPVINNLHLSSKDLQLAYRNCESAIKWFLENTNCKMVNPAQSFYLHWIKPKQLKLFSDNWIKVPKTYITNDIDFIKDLMKNNSEKYIYKPVLGWYNTRLLTENDFFLISSSFSSSPITVQQYIKWVDIRVYIIGNKIYWLKIETDNIDFRDDNDVKVTPIKLDKKLKEDCFKVAKLSGYLFTWIDIKLDENWDYYFLEANPSPMFMKVEKETWYPISDDLVNLLIN